MRHSTFPRLSLTLFAIAVLSMSAGPRQALAQKTIKKQNTLTNKSAVAASGAHIVGKADALEDVTFFASARAAPVGPPPPKLIWKALNLNPMVNSFDWKKADLTGMVADVPAASKSVIDYTYEDPGGNGKPGIDASRSYFTDNADKQIIGSLASLSTFQSININGNTATVSIENSQDQAVFLTGLIIRQNNSMAVDAPGFFVADGDIAFQSDPLMPMVLAAFGSLGDTFTFSFTISNPGLAVSVQDNVALSSSPSDIFFELTATAAVPEPASMAMLATSLTGIAGWRLARGRTGTGGRKSTHPIAPGREAPGLIEGT